MEIRELAERARKAADRSYSPYSGIRVGCALETGTGEIFTGCNVENASFSLTLCAERVAVFKMVSEGAAGVKRIAIWSDTGFFLPPCGACLQVLSEWMSNGGEVILVREDGETKVISWHDLLPMDLTNLRDHLK